MLGCDLLNVLFIVLGCDPRKLKLDFWMYWLFPVRRNNMFARTPTITLWWVGFALFMFEADASLVSWLHWISWFNRSRCQCNTSHIVNSTDLWPCRS